MRYFLFAATLALALAAPARAQIVIYNSGSPGAAGAHVITTPPFFNGLAFSNGTITAFPVAPRYGYPGFGSPYYGPPVHPYGYPRPPAGYSGYGSFPGGWRP